MQAQLVGVLSAQLGLGVGPEPLRAEVEEVPLVEASPGGVLPWRNLFLLFWQGSGTRRLSKVVAQVPCSQPTSAYRNYLQEGVVLSWDTPTSHHHDYRLLCRDGPWRVPSMVPQSMTNRTLILYFGSAD